MVGADGLTTISTPLRPLSNRAKTDLPNSTNGPSPTAAAVRRNVMYCMKCGLGNSDESTFCVSCGQQLQVRMADQSSVAIFGATALAAAPALSATSDPMHASDVVPISDAEERLKGVKGWLLFFCIVMMVLGPMMTLSALQKAPNLISLLKGGILALLSIP